ncbi:protein of unknown function [Tenacibaculum jejuense]|uniref:Uncharacterized protein n=1 Tax=Tenacibaculum jejuense TaxID=584609 RepID=A0A238U8T8_9FLAO|nr:protein of unknown function [Tenacibaculum jejuense]
MNYDFKRSYWITINQNVSEQYLKIELQLKRKLFSKSYS